jgi:hypothetical protein
MIPAARPEDPLPDHEPEGTMLRTLVLTSLFAAGLLAGTAAAQDVSAKLKGSSLVITGSDSDDQLEIANTAPTVDGDRGSSGTTVVIVPGSGTVNGSSEPASFSGVTKLRFVLNGGADQLVFTEFSFTGALIVRGGDGADEFAFNNCSITGPIKLLGEGGDDVCNFLNSSFDGPFKLIGSTGLLDLESTDSFFGGLLIKGGPGVDVVDIQGGSADSAKISLSLGDDQVLLDAFSVGQTLTVVAGPGVNNLSATNSCSIGENLLYRGGTGDDTVVVQDSSVGENLDIKLFGGANDLTLASITQSLQIGEHLVVSGGAQTDELTLSDGNGVGFPAFGVGSGAKLALKGGVNDVSVTGFTQINGLSITLGPLDDTVNIDGAQIQDKLSVALSNGTNQLTIHDAELQDDLFVTAGAGDDTVALTGSTSVEGTQKIHLGGGNNTGP